MPDKTYVWCFSHGRLHTFGPDGAWCTAQWVRLNGDTEGEARADKQHRFGAAMNTNDLSLETQLMLINETICEAGDA